MPDISRRRFLQAGVLAGAGAAVGTVTAASTGATDATAASNASDSAVATMPAVRAQALAFHGPHQAALLGEPTRHTTFVSFDVVSPDAAGLRDLLRVITQRARLLYAGGLPVNLGPAAPTDDNGILGPTIPPGQVALVVALGTSVFDDRYGLAPRRPVHLTTMRSFPNDNLDPALLHGDLTVQICATDEDTVAHALRDVTKHTRGAMQPRWKVDGFVSPPRPAGTPRNLLGFKDGTSNPDVTDPAVLEELVWVRGQSPEPAWSTGGTYLVVRVIRQLVEFWIECRSTSRKR